MYDTVNDIPIMEKDLNMTNMEPIISINYSLPIMIIVAVFLLLLIITTVFGNLLVGLALFKFRQLRTVSNCLIGNLAVSDFLLSTTILPLSAFNECLGYWVFGEALCYFWLCVDVLYCTASIWNLCVIAFDRFTALFYPMWYREKRSTKQTCIYIFMVWILSFAICVPPLVGWNDIQDSYVYDRVKGIYKCVLFSTESYVLYSASGSFFLPFLITTSLYICIFVVIIKRRHSTNVKSKSRLEKRAMKEAGRYSRNGGEAYTLKNVPELDGNQFNKNECNAEEKCYIKCNEKSYQYKNSDSHDMSDDKEQNHTSCETLIIHNSVPQEKIDKNIENVKREAKSSDVSNVHKRKNEIKSSNNSLLNFGEQKQYNVDDHSIKGKLLSVLKFKKDEKKETEAQTTYKTRRFDQREVRATIRMAIIIACFCGCWLGFFVIYVVRSFCTKYCVIPLQVDAFFFWLGYSNSSMNPILYAIFNEEFRRAFQKILGCHKMQL